MYRFTEGFQDEEQRKLLWCVDDDRSSVFSRPSPLSFSPPRTACEDRRLEVPELRHEHVVPCVCPIDTCQAGVVSSLSNRLCRADFAKFRLIHLPSLVCHVTNRQRNQALIHFCFSLFSSLRLPTPPLTPSRFGRQVPDVDPYMSDGSFSGPGVNFL